MPVKTANGPSRIHSFNVVARAPRIRDSWFKGVNRDHGRGPGRSKNRFVFVGHLWSDGKPSGHTSVKGSNAFMTYNTGKLDWSAHPTTRAKFKRFRGIAGPIVHQRDRHGYQRGHNRRLRNR